MNTKTEREQLLEQMRAGAFWKRDQRVDHRPAFTPPQYREPSKPAQFVIAVFCCVAVAVLCVLGWGRR